MNMVISRRKEARSALRDALDPALMSDDAKNIIADIMTTYLNDGVSQDFEEIVGKFRCEYCTRFHIYDHEKE